MKKYTDYIYYKTIYMGNMPENIFDKLLLRASNEIKSKIGNKEITGYEEEVKFTTCFVIDLLYKIEQVEQRKEKLISDNKVVSSEQVEDLSRTYANINNLKELEQEISNLTKKISKEIEKNLYYTGLLYRGV